MDRSRAEGAQDEARDVLTQEIELAASPDEVTLATDKPTEWCPATIPCIGRPAYIVNVPVRVVAADSGPRQVGSKAGDVEAVYCPQCRTMKSRTRETA